ncbi:pre-peptidase C-terminal domain-containing protein [Thalassoglobus polymorphus]|uniref:Uncharacterized protein n=1 Tax=Thalassoglobus polymorphus TaxID=2527994 RepID=A0A517QVD4_9PLAN|nr:pre-peptidase C-terminal domain-containing protein [Thalassoglobus polymorphus]QDT35598.1 hypothetical protein Mal48_48760 [Thalassoglobus polymorphus]
MLRLTCMLLMFLFLPAISWGQTSYPMLMGLKPAAAQLGTSSEHELESRYSMFGADRVIVSGEGVTGKIVTPMEPGKDGKVPSLTKIKIEFTVTKEAAEGVREFRVLGPTGASTLGQVVITRLPIANESDKNDTIETATEVTVPAAICGTVEKSEDVDLFKFHLDAPATLTFHTLAMRLQDKIHDLQSHVDPILTIRNSTGSTVAAADNVYAADPYLSHTFSEAGDYYIEVRDVRYKGNRYWNYVIEVSDQPYIETIHPIAVQQGQPASVKLIGTNLGELDSVEWQPGEGVALGMQEVQLPLPGGRSNPVLLAVSEHPVEVEQLFSEGSEKGEQAISIPGGIAGQIEQVSDIDSYKFTAKKGERFTFETIARRLNSAMDPIIWITNSDGKSLSENDDLRTWGKRTYQDSMIENWAAPADGDYVINIRDVHLRGGEQFTYFLSATRSEPYFELVLDTDKTQLTPGTSGVLFARTVRKNGFTGEIELSVENLPEGVTAHGGRILSTGTDGCIILEAAADAKPTAMNIIVHGKATVGEGDEAREVSVAAQSMQEIYMPGGGRNHWPVSMHTVAVGAPSDIRSVQLDQMEISLKPGESIKVGVTIERAEGFDKNVTLDMLFQHLSTKYANVLPKGITIDSKKSKTLLTAKESSGHLLITAAKDAPAVEKQLCSVMANISLNFVMKATYSSQPLFISVVPEVAAEKVADADKK